MSSGRSARGNLKKLTPPVASLFLCPGLHSCPQRGCGTGEEQSHDFPTAVLSGPPQDQLTWVLGGGVIGLFVFVGLFFSFSKDSL